MDLTSRVPLGRDVVVLDLVAWRRERMGRSRRPFFTLAPDWVKASCSAGPRATTDRQDADHARSHVGSSAPRPARRTRGVSPERKRYVLLGGHDGAAEPRPRRTVFRSGAGSPLQAAGPGRKADSRDTESESPQAPGEG